MSRFRLLLAAGVAMVSFGSAANAALITTTAQSFNFGTPATTDFNNPVSFNLFNTTLGTLISVNFTGTYTIQSQVTVQNNAATTSSGNVKAEGFLQYQSTNSAIQAVLNSMVNTNGGPVGNGSITLPKVAFDLLGTTVAYSLDPGANTSVTSDKTSGSATTLGTINDTTASDLNAFKSPVGAGANLSAATFTQTLLANSGGNTSSSQVTTGAATFSVSYTYDNTPPPSNVPEPASMALLGAGLIGAGLLRRRAK